MKGIIIYENDLRAINAVKLKNASFCYESVGDDNTDTLKGRPVTCKSANCNKEDTYDFETGALIALMKMCKFDKSYKAIEEAFKYNSYDAKKSNEYEKKIHALEEENEKLKKENSSLNYIISCNESTIESLENTRYSLNKGIDYLRNENKKLKLDCEKLQHGYVDTDMMFCGGRGTEKQHKALVELFKKIPRDKVDAAYKESYNTTLPLWQKEVLKQMHDIHTEFTGKIELPRTLDINDTVYRKSIQIKDFGEQINKLTVDSLIEQSRAFTRKCVNEWLCKPLTKREEMWKKIFALHKESDVIIKVKKEDVNAFLHEIENKIPEITWKSTVKIFETKYTIGDIYEALKTCDEIYFRLRKENKLSYSSDEVIYAFRGFKPIDYLPPMRWDLFKKGRLVVGVKNNNELEEFRKEVERNTGIKDIPTCPTNLCLFYSFDRDNYKIILETIEKPNIVKINSHKVYYWEDVR